MSRAQQILYLTNYVGPTIGASRGIDSHSEAANRRVIGLTRGLLAAGYDVQVYSAGWKRCGLSGKYLGPAREPVPPVGLTCQYGSYWDVPLMNAIICLCSAWRWIIRCRRANPDCAILCYNPTLQSGLPAIAARVFLGVPVYLQLEDGTHLLSSIGFVRSGVYRILLRLILRGAVGVIVPASCLADLAKGVPCIVVRGCEDAANQTPSRWNRKSGEKLTFLFSSTLDDVRGTDLLIEALDLLESSERLKGEPVRFWITGKGPLSGFVQERCESYSTFEARYWGFVADGEYEELRNGSHVGLALQKHDHPFSRACFPSKVIELLGAGLLVVSSRVSDLKSLGRDKCLFYEEDSGRALADVICRIIDDPETCFALAVAGQSWVRMECDPAGVGRKLQGLIG